jgi:hypothetical protein
MGEGLVWALRDARVHFYRRAFHALDPAIHGPSKDGETVAATAVIAGRD